MCRVEFLSLTALETENPCCLKVSFVKEEQLVSNERENSSTPHKSSLSVQSQNGRAHSRTLG